MPARSGRIPFYGAALSPIPGEQRVVAFAGADPNTRGAIAYGVETPPVPHRAFETGVLAAGPGLSHCRAAEGSAMNHSPFWPLVWKEYRAARAFWLSMAGLGLLAQMTAFWLTRRPVDRDWWLYGLALMVATGFAVGIGGTLFAIEHEDRTFGLLRMLPLRPGELGAPSCSPPRWALFRSSRHFG